MGNSAAGLPYDATNAVEYSNNNYWQLTDGAKHAEKEETKESVSIFRFIKAQHPDRISLSQRYVQKLRVLKHPYVVSYLESIDMEDSIALVTEACVPFENWLANTKSSAMTAENQSNLVQELIWGFRCILQALNFLHSNGSMLHGNLGMHAIFVVPGGDWKIGSMELACNMSLAEDVKHFMQYQHILTKPFSSPERLSLRPGDAAHNDTVLKARNPPFYIDIYSVGQCIQQAFNTLNLEMPSSLSKYIALMLHSDIKKRPTALKLTQSALFNSEYIRLLESISELSLKSSKEALEVMAQLEPKIGELSKSMCAHKILPNVCRSLQMAINDFPNRDAREACRQNVQVSINLLSSMAAINKLDEGIFRRTCVPIIVQLWPMTDRTVRTVLLQSLKNLADLIPSSIVNKTIFDNIVAGFSDSNAKLRESTLMSLIFIVDKLDEAVLQDRLVRCIINLQNDGEASIRTNATIFLGKIATKLKESVRVRVLCNSFAKAMKDNFLHCRLAGLKTSTACVKLLDVVQISTKILPQACILLLDKSFEVRAQSLLLVDACMDLLRANHLAMGKGTEQRSDMGQGSSSTQQPVGGQESSSGTDNSWSSWSVLQGLSKTIETATTSASVFSAQHAQQTAASPSTTPVSTKSINSHHQSFDLGTNSTVEKNKFSLGASASLDKLDMSSHSAAHSSGSKLFDGGDRESQESGRWEESSAIQFDDEEPTTAVPVERQIRGLSLSHSSSIKTRDSGVDESGGSGKASRSVTKAPKVLVKKLDVGKEDASWDDF